MSIFNFNKKSKLDKIMAQLSDFQAQLTIINTAVEAISSEIATLQTSAASTMSAADEATVLTALSDLATKLQSIVPATTA